tara:strand:- start:6261 stop:6569 length:309 start_codon:yes stop_codon:yes gene_type:complete
MSEIEKMYMDYYVEKDELERRLDAKQCGELVARMKDSLKGAFQKGDTSTSILLNRHYFNHAYSNNAIECAMRRIKSDGATVVRGKAVDSCEFLDVSFDRSHS